MKKITTVILFLSCTICLVCYFSCGERSSIIRIGITSKPEKLIPYRISSSGAYRLLSIFYDDLSEVGDDNKVKTSQMVANFQTNEDEIILTLKKGIRFHKGTEATAVDLKYSLQQAIEANKYNIRTSTFKTIQNIEILDRYSVKIKLSEYYPALLHYFLFVALVHPPNEKVNGTGPYMLEKQNSTSLVLKRNTLYFKNLPKCDKITCNYYSNQHQLWRALIEGEIDFADGLFIEDYENLKDNDKFHGYTHLSHLYFIIAFNCNDLLFSSKKVRLALNYAIDKEKIVEKNLGGYGVVCRSTIFPESWAYNDNISPLRYDPKRAIRLLREEGWELNTETGLLQKGEKIFEFVLHFDEEDQSKEEIANQIAVDLFEYGIRAKPIAVSRKDFVEKVFMNKDFQAVFIQLTGESPDASYNFWHSSQIENGFNYCSYRNTKVDEALWLGRITRDRDKRRAYYLKYQEVFINDPPGILLYYRHNFAIGRRNLKGVKPNMFGFFNNVEDWYLEN